MKILNKLALFAMVLLLSVVSIPVTQVSAATAPGTEQQLTRVASTNAVDYFYAVEGDEKFVVYCFNSSLHWPEGDFNSEGVAKTNLYTPDDFNHLDDSVKEKIYRIFYAGYPHNNAGLYVEVEKHIPIIDLIKEALELDETLLGFFPELRNITLTYFGDGSGTIENIESVESEAFMKACSDLFYWGVSEDPSEQEKADKISSAYPNFYVLMMSYFWASQDDISALPGMFEESLPSAGFEVTEDEAHLATQYAIWKVLNKEGIPNNSKDLDSQPYPALVDRLVDFAYGTDPIPSRDVNFSEIIPYAESFNNGEHFLNSDNKNVKEVGIKFVKNPFDGLYYSEKLHFSQDAGNETYMSPFEISIINGASELSKIITHGKDELTLVSKELPSGASVKLQSTNYWPSPIYQYVAKSDQDKGSREFQEMSGVYYKPVELGYSMDAYAENGALTIKKQVTNNNAANGVTFWFDANIAVKDVNGNQLSGDLPFVKYDLNTDGSIIESSRKEGKVHNFGNTGGNNTKFSLNANQAIVFPDLPYGTTYSVTEYSLNEVVSEGIANPLGNWTPSYTANGVDGNSGTLIKGSENTVVVKNTYAFTPISVGVIGNKTLKEKNEPHNNVDFVAGDFNFVMWPDVHGYPMPEDSVLNPRTGLMEKVVSNGTPNSGIATFDFGTIAFDAPGTYRYIVEEQQVTKEDISKDPHHYDVIVTVSDNSGTLKAETTVSKHDSNHQRVGEVVVVPEGENALVTFENTFSTNEIDKEIRIKKSIINKTSNKNIDKSGYRFNIVPDTTNQPIESFPKFKNTDSSSVIVETGVSGEAISPLLEFTSEWFNSCDVNKDLVVELDYNINEIPGNLSGIKYDKQTAKAKIIVNKHIISHSDETQEIRYSAEIKYTYKDASGVEQKDISTPAVFTNVYSAEGKLDLDISKKITSAITYTPANGEFYEVYIGDNFERNVDENGTKTGYILPDDNPKLTYNSSTSEFVLTNNEIKFTKEGDYSFELIEIVPSDPVTGITYDTNKWIVDVNVKDKGDGTLDVVSEYYSEKDKMVATTKAKFENKFTAEVTVPVKLSKELIGRDLKTTDSFTIDILHCEGEGINPLDPSNICTSHKDMTHLPIAVLSNTNGYIETITNVAKIHKAGTYFLTFKEKVPATTTMTYDPSVYVVEIVVEQPSGDNALKIVDGYPKYYKAPDASSWKKSVKELTSNEFVFTNKVTNLSLKKEAIGMNASLVYGFNIKLSDSSDAPLADKMFIANINGAIETISTDAKGKFAVELKNGEFLEITDLPDGTKYTIEEITTPSCDTEIVVSEDGTEKPKTKGKTVEDELVAGVKEEVLVINTAKKPDEKPKYPTNIVDTGDNSKTGSYMALAGLSALGVALVTLTINKLEKN